MEKLLLILFASILLFACQQKKETSKEFFCTELYSTNYKKGDFDIKATSLNRSLWPHSINSPIIITIKFLNGTEFQKNKVIEYSKIWNEVSALNSTGPLHEKYKVT